MTITVEVECFNNRTTLAKVTKALILAGSFSQLLELLLFREEVGIIRKYYNGGTNLISDILSIALKSLT